MGSLCLAAPRMKNMFLRIITCHRWHTHVVRQCASLGGLYDDPPTQARLPAVSRPEACFTHWCAVKGPCAGLHLVHCRPFLMSAHHSISGVMPGCPCAALWSECAQAPDSQSQQVLPVLPPPSCLSPGAGLQAHSRVHCCIQHPCPSTP